MRKKQTNLIDMKINHGPMSANIGAILLAILVFVGQLKAIPELSWIPVDLTLVCASSVFACAVLAFARGVRPSRKILLPFYLWIIFLFPVFVSPNTPHATYKITLLFTVTLISVISPFVLLTKLRQRKLFLWTLFIIAVYVTFSSLFSPDSYANSYTNRITIEGVNTIGTGQMVSTGALICFLAIFRRETRILFKLILIFVASVFIYVALASGSRGPVIAVVIALITVLIISPAMRRFRWQAAIGLSLIFCISIVGASLSGSDGLVRVLSFVSGDGDESSETRAELWFESVGTISNFPLGIGWGGFQTSIFTYPHNLIIEIVLESGIIIGSVVILYIILSMRESFVASKLIDHVPFFALLIFSFVNSMVSSDINGNRFFWIMLSVAWVVSDARIRALTPRKNMT